MKQIHSFPDLTGPLATASAYANNYRCNKTNLHPTATLAQLRNAFGGDLPAKGQAGEEVIADLIRAAEPGLVGNTQPGFHAWVMGSSHPTGVAADWLTSVWGQNAGIFQCSPAAATAEEVACGWVLDILDLPREASVGITTGATMSGFIGLAAARDEVLRRAGYDVAETGLQYAPPVTVFVSEETHVSNLAALRYLGFGNQNVVEIGTDDQGRMMPEDMAHRMAQVGGPKIMIATAGHINSGAFDDFRALADLADRHNAWLHVDAAFGLWARANVTTRSLTNGIDRADSWSTDGHKWLQTPFDAGFAIVRDKDAHRRAMDISASYLSDAPGDGRNATHYNPELSRRARGFAVWATLKTLGRDGIANMVRNHCDCASLLAEKLNRIPGITVLNDVVLNQLVLSFAPNRNGGADDMALKMEQAMNADGRHFFRCANWQGQRVLRVSIISHETGPQHIQLLARKFQRIWAEVSH
ncbi:aminotransferase class V-fold PLP-dependent enzyme [uncultured Roseovarius sp.]|uniref:pyridoxal phosphate-dependent decarboxylase family protein n=1 Tax=uncultured Roseovarius sp. TaxID=293344 RepID=UPI002611CE8D|nr:aminotransferase class V-fold PLP-dependent enzyme [uncultured Roseovarius sp.]